MLILEVFAERLIIPRDVLVDGLSSMVAADVGILHQLVAVQVMWEFMEDVKESIDQDLVQEELYCTEADASERMQIRNVQRAGSLEMENVTRLEDLLSSAHQDNTALEEDAEDLLHAHETTSELLEFVVVVTQVQILADIHMSKFVENV